LPFRRRLLLPLVLLVKLVPLLLLMLLVLLLLVRSERHVHSLTGDLSNESSQDNLEEAKRDIM
jgi:hypothetical protein